MAVAVSKLSVLRSIQPELSRRGFELKLGQERFTRSTEFGAQFFQLVFTERAGALLVSPGAYVRFSQVERFLNQVSELPPEDHGQSFTIGVDFWQFFNDKFLRFVALNEGDLAHLAPSVINSFDQHAAPYFAEHDSLKDVDALLNDHPEEKCPHRPLAWLRAATGIVVARLVERTNFLQLLDSYSRQMQTFSNGFYNPRFQKLVELLPPWDSSGAGTARGVGL